MMITMIAIVMNLFVLDSPLEEAFAGFAGEEAVVVAGHLQQNVICANALKSESESENGNGL